MRPIVLMPVLLALVLLASTGCEPSPSASTLRDAFFGQITSLHGVTSFKIDRETMRFEMVGDEYVCVVTETSISPIEDDRYTHIGSLDCSFTVNGQPLHYFDQLRRAGIEPDAIVAAWDSQSKRWRFDVDFQSD